MKKNKCMRLALGVVLLGISSFAIADDSASFLESVTDVMLNVVSSGAEFHQEDATGDLLTVGVEILAVEEDGELSNVWLLCDFAIASRRDGEVEYLMHGINFPYYLKLEKREGGLYKLIELGDPSVLLLSYGERTRVFFPENLVTKVFEGTDVCSARLEDNVKSFYLQKDAGVSSPVGPWHTPIIAAYDDDAYQTVIQSFPDHPRYNGSHYRMNKEKSMTVYETICDDSGSYHGTTQFNTYNEFGELIEHATAEYANGHLIISKEY